MDDLTGMEQCEEEDGEPPAITGDPTACTLAGATLASPDLTGAQAAKIERNRKAAEQRRAVKMRKTSALSGEDIAVPARPSGPSAADTRMEELLARVRRKQAAAELSRKRS